MSETLDEARMLQRIALRDQRAFEALVAVCSPEDFPAAAFHAQQAVEKAFKAVLLASGAETSRTHDLMTLGKAVQSAGVLLPVDESALLRLTPYAVGFRYDDVALPLVTPDQAASIVKEVLAWSASILENNA
jgi:HEPN domain-containing protein